MDFVGHLRAWYASHQAMARNARVTLTFGQSDVDRPKPSAWLDAEHGGRESDLVVWSSREAEFLAGGPGRIEVNEHHDLENAEDLDELLDRFGPSSLLVTTSVARIDVDGRERAAVRRILRAAGVTTARVAITNDRLEEVVLLAPGTFADVDRSHYEMSLPNAWCIAKT